MNKDSGWKKKKKASLFSLCWHHCLHSQKHTFILWRLKLQRLEPPEPDGLFITLFPWLFFMGDLRVLSCQLQSRRSGKRRKPPRRLACACVQRSRAIIPSDVHEAENCQRLRGGRLGKKKARAPQEHGKKWAAAIKAGSKNKRITFSIRFINRVGT